MLTPSEFLDSYCEIGYKKARSPAGRILLLAILAGILIGMGAVVSNTSSHALENLSVARVVCGFLFPFGLVMVLFTGAELFTGNCLITIPVLERRVAWTGMLADQGTANQLLRAVGLGDFAHVWLGDQSTSLNAVGVIGFWLQLGFCVVLLLSGIGGIDQSLYEAASLDGAGWWRQLFSITLPGLRGQIGVCLTMTIISALASFDVVYMSTQGGPGTSTMVPGVQVYRLAFTQQSVGLASALAVTLMILVLLVVGPLQRLVNGKEQ